MIVQDLLPEIYYKESRDFAYIGRCLEIIFNYMKTGADCVNDNIDDESDNSTTVDLLLNSLGFIKKHSYINKDLIYLANTFSELLRYKGSKKSIELAIKLLLNSQHIDMDLDGDYFEYVDGSNNTEIEIKIPYQLTDLALLEDIFDYILPAGMLYKFTKYSKLKSDNLTTVVNTDTVSSNIVIDSVLGDLSNSYVDSGIGLYYELLASEPQNWSTNYTDYYICEYDSENDTYNYVKVPQSDPVPVFESNKYYSQIEQQLHNLGSIGTGVVVGYDSNDSNNN